MMLLKTLLLSALAFAGFSAFAEPIEFSSGTEQVALIELYTSQGCSSCPPAERTLNKLIDDKRLWKSFVPIAYHVDYWDRLGWKDPFASKANTDRQRAHGIEGNVSSIYTPCFVINGNEWRGYFDGQKFPQQKTKAAKLSAKLIDGRLEVRYSASIPDLKVHVAIVGTGIETNVTRGENRNRTLSQEFVALWERNAPLGEPIDLADLDSLAKANRYAIEVWITQGDSLKPIQAIGTWL